MEGYFYKIKLLKIKIPLFYNYMFKLWSNNRLICVIKKKKNSYMVDTSLFILPRRFVSPIYLLSRINANYEVEQGLETLFFFLKLD